VTILTAKSIYKSYLLDNTEISVLRDINLNIDSGEILAILGPSGAGKSTLLHILGLLDDATAGEIVFKGQTFRKGASRRKTKIRGQKIGIVFQFYNLLPDFTVLENVYFPVLLAKGRFRPNRVLRKRAEEILELVGLAHRLRHRPGELSGGEQQRVAIARAVINRPELLLADEPTGNLDSEAAERIWSLLAQLNKELGQTIVIVTHNKELAKRAQRVVYLQDGVIRN